MKTIEPQNVGNACSMPRPHPGLSMIIPAYNEEAGLAHSLDMLLTTLATLDINWEVIVVNDGSSDRTVQVASAYHQVRLVSHPVNIGYGNSLKTGILLARYDWIGICDADGSLSDNRVAPSSGGNGEWVRHGHRLQTKCCRARPMV